VPGAGNGGQLLALEERHLDSHTIVGTAQAPRQDTGSLGLEDGQVCIRARLSTKHGPGGPLILHVELAQIAQSVEGVRHLSHVQRALGMLNPKGYRPRGTWLLAGLGDPVTALDRQEAGLQTRDKG
jgi:hypothetical protein